MSNFTIFLQKLQFCFLTIKVVLSFFKFVTSPFNGRACLYIGQHIFVNNSQASIARELFKPSKDSASFLVLIKNKIIWFKWGVFLGDVTKRTCFLFWPNLTGLGRQCNESYYWLKLFLETRRSAASIEHLTDLLGCLEPTLWSKNPILLQIQKIAENALSFPPAAFRIVITRR